MADFQVTPSLNFMGVSILYHPTQRHSSAIPAGPGGSHQRCGVGAPGAPPVDAGWRLEKSGLIPWDFSEEWFRYHKKWMVYNRKSLWKLDDFGGVFLFWETPISTMIYHMFITNTSTRRCDDVRRFQVKLLPDFPTDDLQDFSGWVLFQLNKHLLT